MNNYKFSNDKSLFDLFNMINPNCYQALIINSIIEDNKTDCLKYLDELKTAFELYKWSSDDKSTAYIDQLICNSDLNTWQKTAIMHIISNNVIKCQETINKEINRLKQNELNANKVNQSQNYSKCINDKFYGSIYDLLYNNLF